jgi:pimeloyl-ACP methyl ester carboxylesterase
MLDRDELAGEESESAWTAEKAAAFIKHTKLALGRAGMQVDELVLPLDRYVRLGGRLVHYLDWGGAGRPVVFLHGLGLTAHTWNLVCLSLRSAYRCYAIDLRGHGDSEWAADGDYSLPAYRADIEAFTAHFGLAQPVIVGMSLGGVLAAEIAKERDVRALVIVDTGPHVDPRGRRQLAEFLRLPPELDSVEEFVNRAMAFQPSRTPELLKTSLLNNLVQLPSGRWRWKYDPRCLDRSFSTAGQRSFRAVWKTTDRIRCPTLVVRGGRSRVLPREGAEAVVAALPRGRLVEIEGAGHTVQGDQPAALADAIRDFLATVWTA